MDVMHWIRGQRRKFKPFLADRVGEILASTKQNPADLLTRGLSVSTLSEQERWWKGPSFLKQDSSELPPTRIEHKRETDVELRKLGQTKERSGEETFLSLTTEDRLEPQRFSSWTKFTRTAAWVCRFIENCRCPVTIRRQGMIQPERRIIRQAQQEVFKEEMRAVQAGKELPSGSKLQPLKPVLDEDGILRCDERLPYAEFLPWETHYPIILLRNHCVSRLIIKQAHEQSYHGGFNQVLSELSTQYWIISAREAIKEWERACMQCRRRTATPAKQIMAPLPELRTRMSLRTFSQTSVDFGGPFITKQGRGKIRQQRYVCLFTCLATRAIHLEASFSLDTDSFLNAFFRMVSRRGLPTDIVCDNGTNFVGGSNELKESEALDHKKIQETTTSHGVKWHFNLSLAPHFSGVHEIMIKAAKKAIYAILGSVDITDEELLSAVVGADGLINSRPLTYQSSDPADLTPLTPNHFLHGQLGGRFPPDSVDNEAFYPRKRWLRVQELVRHFWHRWLQEWIPSLSTRKKWCSDQVDLKVGDVIFVMSPDTPRGKWPLGRVVKVFPGKDSRVRVVDVQVGKTVLWRPIEKLCPLERC